MDPAALYQAPWINCSLCCLEVLAQAVGHGSLEWLWERWAGRPAYADALEGHVSVRTAAMDTGGSGTPLALIIGTTYDQDYSCFTRAQEEECDGRIAALAADFDFITLVDSVATQEELEAAFDDERRIFDEECARLYVAEQDRMHEAVVYSSDASLGVAQQQQARHSEQQRALAQQREDDLGASAHGSDASSTSTNTPRIGKQVAQPDVLATSAATSAAGRLRGRHLRARGSVWAAYGRRTQTRATRVPSPVELALPGSPLTVHVFDEGISDMAVDSHYGAIAHQTDCVSVQPRGIAFDIAGRWPEVSPYRDRPPMGPQSSEAHLIFRPAPGSIGEDVTKSGLLVISLHAQYWPGAARGGSCTTVAEVYDSFEQRAAWFAACLQSLGALLQERAVSKLALPLSIGCDLAGGHWPDYLRLITCFARDFPQISVHLVGRADEARACQQSAASLFPETDAEGSVEPLALHDGSEQATLGPKPLGAAPHRLPRSPPHGPTTPEQTVVVNQNKLSKPAHAKAVRQSDGVGDDTSGSDSQLFEPSRSTAHATDAVGVVASNVGAASSYLPPTESAVDVAARQELQQLQAAMVRQEAEAEALALAIRITDKPALPVALRPSSFPPLPLGLERSAAGAGVVYQKPALDPGASRMGGVRERMKA